MEQMGDQIENYVEQALRSATFGGMQIGVSTGVMILLGVVIVMLVIFAIISIAAAFLRYHNFTLYLDGRTLNGDQHLNEREDDRPDQHP